MNCPVCAIELKISERQGIEIDYCPQCRGIWLDRGELDKIIDKSNNIAPYGGNSNDYYNPNGSGHHDGGHHGGHHGDQHGGHNGGHHGRRRSFLEELFD